jgi:4-hydroxy-2-oxoheptanedioate aldolase
MTLDAGADGVMVPMVDTPDQAEAVVRAAKFPPLGDRSFGGRRVIDTRGRMYAHTSNDATFLMAQIETPEGLENVDAIAAVDGVDIIFLGPDDMRLRRGERMDEPRSMEQLERDMERVAEAGRANGKPCAMPAIGSEMIQLCQRIGFQIICCGMDAAFLADGSQAASQVARKTLAEGSPVDVKGDPESLY